MNTIDTNQSSTSFDTKWPQVCTLKKLEELGSVKDQKHDFPHNLGCSQGVCKFLRWSTTSLDMLRHWISDRWRTLPWIWVELFVLVPVPSLLGETQWRTRIRWFFDLLEKVPYTLTSKITSLSLVTSHHEFCGWPSTNPSDMWDSSRRTETSTIWLGLIIPVAGETWYSSKK